MTLGSGFDALLLPSPVILFKNANVFLKLKLLFSFYFLKIVSLRLIFSAMPSVQNLLITSAWWNY